MSVSVKEKDYSAIFTETLAASIQVKQRVLAETVPVLNEIVNLLRRSLAQGNKIMLCGNGGSAADSQHIAAELVSKFNSDRRALPAIALTTDTSILTSIANDYGYDLVFARQIEALGQAGDVVIGLSTSGHSPNILKAMSMAKEKGLSTVALTGMSGGKLKDCVDICYRVPSDSTPRIQEVHITVAHAFCDILEKELG
ncbi:MAG: D-sedoheptulose 7-phosphate isomerase [bacterium]